MIEPPGGFYPLDAFVSQKFKKNSGSIEINSASIFFILQAAKKCHGKKHTENTEKILCFLVVAGRARF